MTRRWLSITVELVEGHGRPVWPRPGRVFAVARHHSFAVFATAIDDAFARWDRAHLHEFHLHPTGSIPTGSIHWDRPVRIADPDPWGIDDTPVVPLTTKVGDRVGVGDRFVYVFDLGDDWTHLCTVADTLIDPHTTVGLPASAMPGPLPYFGWGTIPDQYQRRYLGDTGDNTPPPSNPHNQDLPPWRPWWGPQPPGREISP